MHRRARWLALVTGLAAVSLLAAACGSDDQESSGAPTTDRAPTAEPTATSVAEPQEAPAPDPEAGNEEEEQEQEENGDGSSEAPSQSGGSLDTADPVRIGILFSNSGAAGVFGPPVANIAEMIEMDINAAGGINGRSVETFLADDATDPEVGRQAMEQLLDSDSVDVVLGTHSSATREAARPLAEAAGVPYIYAALYEGGECSPVMFNTGEVPSQQLKPAIPWMMEETGGAKWFLLGNDYVWPRRSFELAREYIEAAGGEVVGEEYVPLGTQDFSSVAQRIAGAGADLIFPALVGGDAVAFETQAVDFGIGQEALPRLANIYEENVLGAMGPAVTAGMRVTLGYFKEIDNPANAEFVARYTELFGADAAPHSTFSSHIYDAALLYAAAANEAGTVGAGAVITAMAGQSLSTPTGDIAVTASRHLAQPIYIAEIGPDGSQTIVQEFAAVEPDETCEL
ncbi:substrate-binding protein [Candidatus Poriferisodalis sp.]|uniref:substrate-binding protein n=1 Tax=Candidatus Poriferisodalis sp. TaxID=3101277 RepID=UPI003B011B9F